MITKSRFSMMTVTVLMVFVLSALWTVPVFADDSTPPPVETPTEVVPPVDEETTVEVPVAEPEAPAAEPEAPAEEPVVVVDETAPATNESAPAEEIVLTEVLEQLPEGTEVQVVDENGEALTLASQEAADTVAASDPIWCPSSVVTPVSGGAGCSPSQTSFNDLLTWLHTNNPGVAGTIWIEKTYDSSVATGTITDVGETDFTLDGLSLTNMANFALTIKGGWNGIGTNVIDVNDQSEFKGASLSIINWKGAITISDILVNAATINPNTSGGFENSALLVDTTGNIQLNRVKVKDSLDGSSAAMNGATLDNRDSGAVASTVIVNNGIFENNEGDGLHIFSAGVVTITSISADGNDKGGVSIDNSFATVDRAVTLSGMQEYNYNGNGAGLKVISRGFVTISNVIANGNAGSGVDIDNHTSLTNQGVTVAGTNMFNDNANGLKVLSHGIITTYNLFASENGADGVNLDNCDGNGTSICNVPGAPSVYLYGSNYFYHNVEDGLDISTFGTIYSYTTNLTASNNGGHGARLSNQRLSSTAVESVGTITLMGYNAFNNNTLDGLNVTSNSDMVAYNLTANENGNNGVSLTVEKVQPYVYSYVTKVKGKKKTIYVTKTEAYITLYGVNKFIGNNGGDGLHASADGAITLYSINADLNGGDGADLTTTAAGNGIALYNTNYFTENQGAGLLANSAGAITLYNINASRNIGNGVDVDNRASPTGLGVTVYGINMFNDNAIGLRVLSHGIITTYNIYASGNSGDGVHLDNCDGVIACSVLGAPYIYLVGPNYFYDNAGDGLDVSTFGQIIAYNLTASYNDLNGARLNNQWFNTTIPTALESSGPISLYGYNSFNNNNADGLNATSSNNIVAYNLTAYGNGDDGVVLNVNKTQPYTYSVRVKSGKKYIYQYYTITAANVTLYGDNSFNGNRSGDGLRVSADGAITIYNLTANGNGLTTSSPDGSGAVLDNCTISTTTCSTNLEVNPVTLYGNVNVSGNNYRGLQVASSGAVTLGNIVASGNLNVGVHINNKSNPSINPAIVRGVTITGTNIFNSNDSTGLFVKSYGAITLTNINAYYNGDSTSEAGSGAYLENFLNRDPSQPEGLIVAKDITITGVNSFVGNYTFGLKFLSSGIVTLSRISADGNDWDTSNSETGAGVSGIAKSITLTCGHMFGNGVNDPAPGYNLQVGLLSAGTAPAVSGVLTLNGIYSAVNGVPADVTTLFSGSTAVVTQACALP